MRQHGVVTRGQLNEAGLSRSAVTRRMRAGTLRPLHRGVFVVGPLVPAWASEMAAVLAVGPDAVVSHCSGLAVWEDRPRPVGETEPVDVTIERVNPGRHRGIRAHRVARLPATYRTVRHGIPVTTPPRTVVDVAGVVGTRDLEAVVARLERGGLLTRVELERAVDRHRGWRGTRALRAVLGAEGGPALTRSEAEGLFLSLVRDAALPVPQTNVRVGRYELDFLWRDAGIAVEIDGFRYHGGRPGFEGDRRKDAWLMAVGIRVLRLSWRQLANESTATIVQVGQALALSRGA